MPRLPFTGIDEISSTSGGSSDEGGGALPPYGEDMFQRIVDVNWAATGGVFVSGDVCCFQRYTRLESNKSADFAWLPLGEMRFGTGGGTESSTFAVANGKPTFLLGGHGPDGGVLMLSNDGYTWTEMQAGYIMGNNIRALVWDADEKLFYAATDDIRPYYSSDGIYWYFSATFLEEHCKGPLEGIPDGIYGYDKKNDVVIYPANLYAGGYSNAAIAVINASTSDAEEFIIQVGLDEVDCVSYTGGIWMAGGAVLGVTSFFDSATVTSLDGGATWFYSTVGDLGMKGNFQVQTMIGAPIKHFRNDPSAPSVAPGAVGTLRGANTPIRRKGPPHANQPQRPGRGVMAAAISGPRRPGPLLRRAFRRI